MTTAETCTATKTPATVRSRPVAPSMPAVSGWPAGPAATLPTASKNGLLLGTKPVDHLDLLESHAIFILREVAAESERPALMFSGGKDSAVLLHLAAKAFRPAGFPFPLLHVDTGHNFPEVIDFRDRRINELGERLIVARVQDSIDQGRVADPGPLGSRNRLQATTLLDAINEHSFDAAIGGARRDEDKARAKERVLSFRDAFGQWDPKRQRPELWQLYQGRVQPGEHVRAFPLSDWTELDIWQYIQREGIPFNELYLARDGKRYRSLGESDITFPVASDAASLEAIIERALAFNPRRDPLILRRSLMHNLRRQPDGNWTWKYDRRRFQQMGGDQHAAERRGLADGLAKITCPTLVVRGAESDVFHQEDAERLAAGLPDGRNVTIPKAGHTVQGDNPKDLVAALREFLG